MIAILTKVMVAGCLLWNYFFCPAPQIEKKTFEYNTPYSSYYQFKQMLEEEKKKKYEFLTLPTEPTKELKATHVNEVQKETTKWVTFELTGYTNGFESTQKQKGDKGFGITASGNPTKANYTIACPREFEFGTKIEIEGLGVRVCEDRGGAIKGKKIDVYFENLTDAREFGRQKRNVRIIEEENE